MAAKVTTDAIPAPPAEPAIVVAPSGAGNAGTPELVAQLKARGAEVVLIADDEALLSEATVALPLVQRVPEWLSTFMCVIPGQFAALRLAQADRFVDTLPEKLDTAVGERGTSLSGGQRQRLTLARALAGRPRLLVLDDATSAVDVQVEQAIHEGLRVLMEGRTTLIVAHRLSTIGLADRVVLVDGGKIVADGTHNELMQSSPQYVEVLAQVDADSAGGER